MQDQAWEVASALGSRELESNGTPVEGQILGNGGGLLGGLAGSLLDGRGASVSVGSLADADTLLAELVS